MPRSSLTGPGTTLLAALALTLAACGGGGGGSSGTTSGNGNVAAAPLPLGTALNASSCTYRYFVTASTVLTGTDPLLARQWHLQNTGQSGGTAGEDIRAFTAWLNAPGLGAGVRVSVIDDAIEIVHEDLAPNVVADASHNYRSDGLSQYPLPCDAADDHGTAVAGIAAARKGNGVGGSGVAPMASLVGFNALATDFDTDIADALTRDKNIPGVYNNSWGSSDDGRLHVVDAVLKNAVNDGLANGRDGKGSVYVFPGGNGGCYANAQIDANDNCLSPRVDNSNFDGYVNRYGVIAACAVSDRGKRPWYGEAGANLLVCGSSSDLSGNVTTTAVKSGYRNDFSGTSATTPMVSGVVALMLSVRPELTYRDVPLILAHTARKNDPTDSGWVTANGLNFNHKYGFGVVDAGAAVQAAKTWGSVGNRSQVVSCGFYQNTVGQPIPDAVSSVAPGAPVTNAITVPASCPITKVEFVEIGLITTHTYTGDLRVRMTSPNGLVSELATARFCVQYAADGSYQSASCGNYDANWLFGSNRHMDEAPPGNWTLQITDMQPSDTGSFDSWSIRFWGR